MINLFKFWAVIVTALAFIPCGTAATWAVPKSASFDVKRKALPGNAVIITIHNAKTGRILWRKTLHRNEDPPVWVNLSPNHQAIAVVQDFGNSPYVLLVWRAEKGLHVYRHLRFPQRLYKRGLTLFRGDLLDANYLGYTLFSPDNKRLLMFATWDMDEGMATDGVELWCLTLKTGHLQVLGFCHENEVRWLTSRKVIFVPAIYKLPKPSRVVATVE